MLPNEVLQRPHLIPRVLFSDAPSVRPRILLIVGMAGSGKTILSRSYLQEVPWPAVVLTLQSGEPGVNGIQALLRQLDIPTARPATALSEYTQPLVVVIDQLETILDAQGAPTVDDLEWINALLHNPALHVLLISRIFPSIPALMNLLALGDLVVIDGTQLAFTVKEAQALWRLRQGYPLLRAEAERLQVASGGLAAIVALACATGRIPDEAMLPVGEEFIERTMEDLPEWLQRVLAETSVLLRLTPDAIEALTGDHEAAHLLREIRRWNLLVSDRPAILHPLVRQYFFERLRADRQRFVAIGRQAIDLALADNDFHQAWQLACDTGLWEEARKILQEAGPRLRQQGNSRMLVEWIERLPAHERDLDTTILHARALADIGDLDGSVLTIRRRLSRESDPVITRELRIWLANIEQARGDLQAADKLIVAYLDDESLSPLWRARVLRIHSIARDFNGDEEAALEYAARAIEFAHASGEQRILALAYLEHGVIALRMGRYAEADRSLQLSERCWRDLDDSPEMAVTLNNRAFLALARRDFDTAFELAQQARLHALAAGRLRDAASSSDTLGDIALAQLQYDDALLHYQVAADDAEAGSFLSGLIYSLSQQAHVARLKGDRTTTAQVLYNLRSREAASARDAAWRISGMVAAQLTLGLPPQVDQLEQALETLETSKAEIRAVLLIMLSQCSWRAGYREKALAVWQELESLIQMRGGIHTRLIPIASAELDLVEAAQKADGAAFADTVLAMHDRPSAAQAPAEAAAPRREQPRLIIRVLGQEQVLWEGKHLELPGRGLELIILLLISPQPLDDEELLRHIWGESNVSIHSLQKLVATVRAFLPVLIKRSGRRYVLGIPRESVDFDLEQFLALDLHHAAVETLLTAAETASKGALHKYHAPWALPLRRQVTRRLALTWLELSRRFAAGGNESGTRDALERAQLSDPTSDFIARAAMQHALRVGDRALAIQYFLRYQQAIYEELGVDPADDLATLYRQAIDP